MDDLTNLAAVLIVVAPLALLLVRIFMVPDGVSLADLIPPPRELDWPRGVQEEDPVPWRVEHLTPPDRGNRSMSPMPAVRAERVEG
jgi:hypothetical protein